MDVLHYGTQEGYYRVSYLHMANTSYGNPDPRHNSIVNVLYGDGHAKPVKTAAQPNEYSGLDTKGWTGSN
jgi:prepilin-type processing-associated H-X9-DG protein